MLAWLPYRDTVIQKVKGKLFVTDRMIEFIIATSVIFFFFLKGSDEFRFQVSLKDAPDLPTWIHYKFSPRHKTGFLYGVAPPGQSSIDVRDSVVFLYNRLILVSVKVLLDIKNAHNIRYTHFKKA